MKKAFRAKKLLSLLLLPFLVACGPLIEFPGSGEAPRHFQLSPASSHNNLDTQGGENITIYLEHVSSPGVLKTTNILVQSSSNELQYYKDALWVDRTPILVERFLIQSLETDNLRLVGSESIEIPAQYRLKVDLRHFAVEAGTGGTSVNIAITAMLLNNGPVEIVGTKNFTLNKRVDSSNIDHIISGFNSGMDEVSEDLLSWMHMTINKS